MAFILQGEVNIDGRKGTVALKSIQREATKTSQAFDRAGGSTSKLVASFLKANSAASVFGTSLRALGRFGAAGILGAGAATALNRFGEAVKKNATDYYQSQKSLADAFETSFKSKNVEEAQAGLARTAEIADELRGKITQLGAIGNILGGFEKLTGLKIFGVEDTKKALEQAQKQLEAQEEIVKARQKEKEQIDAIENATRSQINQRKVTAETLKLIDSVRKTRKSTIPTLEIEVENALALRNENERILDILEKTNQGERNKEEIQKRRITAAQLELNIIKAQNALTVERLKKTGETLGGSRAGQQALSVAQKQKERSDKNMAFKEEAAAVKERQAKENATRASQGLPPLNQADIRKRMAAEAVGGEITKSTGGVGANMQFSQGNYKSREAQKVMQEAASQKKEGYQKTKIRGGIGGISSSAGSLEAAIKSLADKIPSAVPQ